MFEPLTDLRLENGLRAVIQERKGPLAGFACRIGFGPRYETDDLSGAAHLIEHLLLRGRDVGVCLPQEIERWGGEMTAETAKEDIVISGRVPVERLSAAVDALAEALTQPLPLEHLDQEKKIVVEELRLMASQPIEVAQDIMYEGLFAGSGLGMPVAGSVESVQSLSPEDLVSLHGKWIRASTLVVALVAPDASAASTMLESSKLSSLSAGTLESFPKTRLSPSVEGIQWQEMDDDYSYVAVAAPGYADSDPLRPAAEVLSLLLGESSSSLLYRIIREQLGLAYDIRCAHRSFSDAGLFRAIIGTAPENVDRVVAEVRSAVARLDDEVGEEKVELGKRQRMGQLLLAWESSAELAFWLAISQGQEQARGPLTELEAIEGLTGGEVAQVARELAEQELQAFAAGGRR